MFTISTNLPDKPAIYRNQVITAQPALVRIVRECVALRGGLDTHWGNRVYTEACSWQGGDMSIKVQDLTITIKES